MTSRESAAADGRRPGDREPVRIGGLELDPLADLALPLLLTLCAGVTVGLVGSAFRQWWGLSVIPGAWAIAFVFAVESYLFTTVFAVREVDLPGALRWVEVGIMLVLAVFLGALWTTGNLLAAVTAGWARWESYVTALLLVYGWFQGGRTARLIRDLHPGLLVVEPGQERLPNDDHAQAYQAIRTQTFGTVVLLAVVLGAGDWYMGDVRVWGWSWHGAGLLLMAALSAGAVLVAARLKLAITWTVEGVPATAEVWAQWMARGLSLLLLPLILALLLPAGPRLPLERLLGLIPKGPKRDLSQLQPPAPPPAAKEPGMEELYRQLAKESKPWITWPTIPHWVWYTLAVLAVLWLLRVAARQLAERSGQVRGALALLVAVARWYLSLGKALQEMLGGVIKQAVVAPAEAVGAAVFGEAGALGRYLPFRNRVPGEPRAAVRYYFARLQAEAGRKGIKRGSGGTAAEFGRRLAEAAPEQAGEIGRLTEAYETARYSDQPVEAEQVTFARRTWAVIARALRRS